MLSWHGFIFHLDKYLGLFSYLIIGLTSYLVWGESISPRIYNYVTAVHAILSFMLFILSLFCHYLLLGISSHLGKWKKQEWGRKIVIITWTAGHRKDKIRTIRLATGYLSRFRLLLGLYICVSWFSFDLCIYLATYMVWIFIFAWLNIWFGSSYSLD